MYNFSLQEESQDDEGFKIRDLVRGTGEAPEIAAMMRATADRIDPPAAMEFPSRRNQPPEQRFQ